MGERYYLFLFVPPSVDMRQVGRELCLLHNAFDFLSEDKEYCVDFGYEYSGIRLVMIHMTVYGIDLEKFVVRRRRIFLKDKYPIFRLWTLEKGYILSAEESGWEYNKYLAGDGVCKEIVSWKGKNYQRRKIKSVFGF